MLNRRRSLTAAGVLGKGRHRKKSRKYRPFWWTLSICLLSSLGTYSQLILLSLDNVGKCELFQITNLNSSATKIHGSKRDLFKMSLVYHDRKWHSARKAIQLCPHKMMRDRDVFAVPSHIFHQLLPICFFLSVSLSLSVFLLPSLSLSLSLSLLLSPSCFLSHCRFVFFTWHQCQRGLGERRERARESVKTRLLSLLTLQLQPRGMVRLVVSTFLCHSLALPLSCETHSTAYIYVGWRGAVLLPVLFPARHGLRSPPVFNFHTQGI